jgi:hypothetical protein
MRSHQSSEVCSHRRKSMSQGSGGPLRMTRIQVALAHRGKKRSKIEIGRDLTGSYRHWHGFG